MNLEETWKPTTIYFMGCALLLAGFVVAGIDIWEGGFELTEEEIEEYVEDDNYMFTVGCWFADQSGRWNDYDVQYDGEFANLLSSYRDGWLKPQTRTAEVVKEEILYVEELVDGWSNDERRSNLIDYYNK